MSKISRGRVGGVSGMSKYNSQELHTMADSLEQKISASANADNPSWLKRRASRLRKLAEQKERALLHKLQQ